MKSGKILILQIYEKIKYYWKILKKVVKNFNIKNVNTVDLKKVILTFPLKLVIVLGNLIK